MFTGIAMVTTVFENSQYEILKTVFTMATPRVESQGYSKARPTFVLQFVSMKPLLDLLNKGS